MEAAINRKTASGRVLGENQKILPLEALKAVTINGAWQAREENIKGSITVGKMADFVVLSDDPLKENTTNFKSIQVVATVKKGKLVYGKFSWFEYHTYANISQFTMLYIREICWIEQIWWDFSLPLQLP